MYYKSWSIETPNWGDWANGSHELPTGKWTYQRTYDAPKLVPIKIDLIAEDFRQGQPIFRFTVDEVLDRMTADFLDGLLFNLNLLQENVGKYDVFETTASRDKYLKTLYVN